MWFQKISMSVALKQSTTIDGLSLINRGDVAGCLDHYQQVWHW